MIISASRDFNRHGAHGTRAAAAALHTPRRPAAHGAVELTSTPTRTAASSADRRHIDSMPTASHLRLVAQRIVAVAIAVATLEAAVSVHAGDDIVLTPKRVSEHVWFFQGESAAASIANKGFMSNAGFVVTGDGVVAFDALGTPALGRAMIAAIGGVTHAPIRRVIVSHYHADHIYGLQAFRGVDAEIWAHRKAELYLASDLATNRLAQRRVELSPWVDDKTRLVPPDVWVDGDTDFRMGGITFRLIYSGGAHSPEDLLMFVVEDRVLFAGDLIFAGRVPFVGTADSRGWLDAMGRMIAIAPAVVIPGHGPASTNVERDLVATRDYVAYLRETMGRAAKEFQPFDDAYAKTDWSRFAALPAFAEANRINAYGTYLRMEQEELDGRKD
jgi:glyoxylase-like metal-dependent hydrolase (beta-lactamase superfamily II)